jgi:hypothetical protein
MNDPTQLTQNLLIPSKFQLQFDRVANTVFYCTKVAVPGLSIGQIPQNTPFVDLKVPGDKIQFELLTFDFLIDVNFSSWYDIFIWLTGVGFPENFAQYAALKQNATRSPGRPAAIGIRPPYSDATLSIYTSKNNPSLKFSFADCFPVALSSIELGYDRSADEVITGTASFCYSYYQFAQLS